MIKALWQRFVNLFHKKPVPTFLQWREAQLKYWQEMQDKGCKCEGREAQIQENKCYPSIVSLGECEHMKSKRLAFDAAIRGLAYAIVNKQVKDLPITVAPVNNVNECGWCVEFGLGNRVVEFLVKRFHHDLHEVEIRYRDTFERIFQYMQSNKYYVESADEPKKLRYGFLVVNGDGITRYWIKISDYKSPTAQEIRDLDSRYLPNEETKEAQIVLDKIAEENVDQRG